MAQGNSLYRLQRTKSSGNDILQILAIIRASFPNQSRWKLHVTFPNISLHLFACSFRRSAPHGCSGQSIACQIGNQTIRRGKSSVLSKKIISHTSRTSLRPRLKIFLHDESAIKFFSFFSMLMVEEGVSFSACLVYTITPDGRCLISVARYPSTTTPFSLLGCRICGSSKYMLFYLSISLPWPCWSSLFRC